jgi:tryptophan halogenase
MAQTKRRVLIVGGGTAGWMTAAALARFLESGWEIALIESDAIGTVGVGEATIPQIQLFNAGLGLDEDQFLRATQGTIKLGIEFDGWTAPGERYMHAFGMVGRGLGLLPFHHYWLRARAMGAAKPFGQYCWNERTAYADRYARPGARPGPFGPLIHAFHFDAALYAAHLRAYAEARGVTRTEGRIVEVAPGPEGVSHVRLESGATLGADLFIDCTGFRGLLIEETLGAGFEDWSEWLWCDRALAVPCERAGAFTPYTRASARAAGWQWRIPLQHRTGNGYVYSSRHLSDDEAAATLLANLDGQAQADPRPLRFKAGRRRSAWVKNTVAIGLSAGFLEPLESTSIHLIQSGIARLLALMPGGRNDAALADEFNRQTAWEWERVRDFIILHYHATGRHEPFWQGVRSVPLPPELAARIELFRETGTVRRDHDELFAEPGWTQVFLGQGVTPERWHPLAETLSHADLTGFLKAIDDALARETAALPLHRDFIEDRCAAR